MSFPVFSFDQFPAVLEATRVFLRVPRQGDGPALLQAVLESRNELAPWLEWARDEPTVESTELWISEQHAKFFRGELCGLLVFDRFTHDLLGASGFVGGNPEEGVVEIGYWLRASRLGRGLMTEAVDCLTQFCLQDLGLARVEIRCDIRNQRSIAVALRAGYKLKHEGQIDASGRQVNVYDCCRRLG